MTKTYDKRADREITLDTLAHKLDAWASRNIPGDTDDDYRREQMKRLCWVAITRAVPYPGGNQ